MFKHFTYEEIDSTNAEARRLLLAGKITAPSLVVARAQSAGRGTQGRTWLSPKGAGLYFSVVHPYAEAGESPPVMPHYTLAAGVACAATLEEALGLRVHLKPVNDLYLKGEKLGGILTESVVQGGELKALITGIGLNVRETPRELSGADDRGVRPTSLQAHLPPHQFERLFPDMLPEQLAARVDVEYAWLIRGGLPDMLASYRQWQLPGTTLEVAGL